MTSRFGRAFAALALVASMAMFSGCVLEPEQETPWFPDDTMEINGTLVDIEYAEISYYAGERIVRFYDVYGDHVDLTFEGQGDPAITLNEVPYGEWLGFDGELVSVHVYLVTGPTDATYTGASPYDGWVSAGGSPPDVLALDAAFTFSDGPIEGFQISWSGPYDWIEEL